MVPMHLTYVSHKLSKLFLTFLIRMQSTRYILLHVLNVSKIFFFHDGFYLWEQSKIRVHVSVVNKVNKHL